MMMRFTIAPRTLSCSDREKTMRIKQKPLYLGLPLKNRLGRGVWPRDRASRDQVQLEIRLGQEEREEMVVNNRKVIVLRAEDKHIWASMTQGSSLKSTETPETDLGIDRETDREERARLEWNITDGL